jgi:hypothetical protein
MDRRFTTSELRAFLVDAGFEPRMLTYRVTALFPAAATSRLLRRGGSGSHVGPVAPALNRVLTALTVAENRVARRRRLPFGLSAFAVGRVPAGQPQAPGITLERR